MGADDVARIKWQLEDIDKRLHAGADTFAAMRSAIETLERRALRWVAVAAMASLASVGAGAWWASQRSSAIEATGRVVHDLRQDVSEARRELAEARRALDRVTQALDYQADRDARQDEDIKRALDPRRR